MATASRRNNKINQRQSSVYIYSCKIWAYDKPKGIGQDGEMVIEYSDSGSYGAKKTVAYPLISAWLDPVNTEKRNTCKAYGLVPQKPKTPAEAEAKRFAEELLEDGGYDCYIGSPAQQLTCDLFKRVIRFGCKEEIYLASSGEQFNWKSQPIYDSKAAAIMSIITALGGYSTAKIAGLDLINLNNISDKVLQELGYTQVGDVCGRGVPMWSGDADKALSMGSASYASNRWSTRRREDEEIQASSQTEVVESFLNLLEAELIK